VEALQMSDVKPVLNQLNIIAKDFAATVKFYRRLGVNVPDGVNLPMAFITLK
jgi:hypothetical protein